MVSQVIRIGKVSIQEGRLPLAGKGGVGKIKKKKNILITIAKTKR